MSNDITELTTRAEIDAALDVVDYVAGDMTADARAAFERRMAADAGLEQQVAEERALRAAMQPVAGEGIPDGAAFERLSTQLAPTPEARRPLRFAAVAASVAIALVLASVWRLQPDTAPVFETLSSDPAAPVAGEKLVRIVFAPGADGATRERVARALGFEIVSGPDPADAFVVRANAEAGAPALDDWRAHPEIEFAERIRYAP